MANQYFTPSGSPATSSAGSSATMRSEFALIEAGFDLLPTLSGNGDEVVVVNSGGTALVTVAEAAFKALVNLEIGTDVQAYDAGLTSIAGLTTAADRMIYTTASDTYAVATLTSAGRALLDDADASAQRTTLGLVIGTDVQAYDADLAAIAALAKTDGNIIVGNGSTWVAESGATARASLGLVIGTNVQAYDAELAAIAGLASAADRLPYFTGSGTASLATLTSAGRALLDDADASAQRTTLGLGTIATQASSSVSITGGSVTGITDLAVADGGTGASTAAAARTSLGLVIGTDVQAYDADLAAIAALAKTDGNIIVGNGSTWVAESGNTARTSLGLGITTGTHNTNITGLVGTVNIDITYRLIGGIVVLHVPEFVGTNDSADALQITTVLPAALRPPATRYDTGKSIKGDSTVTYSGVTISASGNVYWNGDPTPDSENWSSYTTNRVYAHTIVYSL